ncbi:MAG: glycosyltransferase family 2 protein [Pseudomonadota bacterium]
MTASVTVVIVSYESADVLAEALAALPKGLDVIVVDNNSQDHSVSIAERAGATVICNDKNLGFGTACNQGAAATTGEFILFLNPDARVSASALDALAAELSDQSDLAATGPLLESDGQISLPRAATMMEPERPATFPTIPSEPVDTGFLSGAALLVRRSAFEKIGGFDEKIFLYLEDDDLCLRLRECGFRLRLIPSAVVQHEKEPNAKSSGGSLRFRNLHTNRSTCYLSQKHDVPIGFDKMRRKAWRRLILALLTFDRVRIHVNIGRLQGLDAWPFDRFG